MITREEHAVGKTIWDQPVRLIGERHYSGKWHWIVQQDPADQRDEISRVAGLTDDAILEMARIITERKKRT